MSEYTGSTIGPELTVEFWNTVFGWLPTFPQVTEPTATPQIVVYILGLGLFTLAVFAVGQRGGEKSSEGGSEESYYEAANEYEGDADTGVFEDIEEIQKTIISTSAYEKDTRIPQIGDDQHVQVFYVPSELYPKIPIDGYLESVMETTDVKYNVTVYFDRQNKERTAARLKSKVATAAAETSTSSIAEIQGKAGRQGRIADIFNEVENGETPFKMSTYAMVRGETKAEVAEARSKIKEVFEDHPVKQPLRTPVGQQKEAFQSVLPIGRDVLGDTDPGRFKSTTVAGAFGTAYASAIKPTTVDPNGIEYGWHKSTQLPLILDPWGHDAGNAKVMVADPGGGKSTTGKALMQRALTQREDVIGVTIEPMGNWAGVAKIFESESDDPGEYEGSAHVTVGGDKGINPLQIREIPPEKRRDLPDDVDPLGDRKSIAMSFLENFFTIRGNQRRFNEHRVVLENAIGDAYSDAKIHHDDLDSHGRQSPTLRDVRNNQLKDRFKNPEKYADEQFRENEIKRAAEWFYSQFEVFDIRENSKGEKIKGNYANFGKQTEFDIFGNKYVYLDLGQSEGNVSEKAKLTMQILLDQVYEMSKQTDKKVILAMDEFRYFIRDVANIDSIENLFRHHRHQDIAPWIMTQTVHEFLQRSESEAILDMCPYFLGQRYDKMNKKDAQKLGLSKDQYEFVSSQAQPGTPERGYADALLLSGNSGQKLEIHLTESELQVSEWDRDDPLTMLPGYRDRDGEIQVESESGSDDSQQTADTVTSSRRREQTTPDYEYPENPDTVSPEPSQSVTEHYSNQSADSTPSPTAEIESGSVESEQATTEARNMESPTPDPDTDLNPDYDTATPDVNNSEGTIEEPEPAEEDRSMADRLINRVFDYLEDDDEDDDQSDENADSPTIESVINRSESKGEITAQLNTPGGENDGEATDTEGQGSGIAGQIKSKVSQFATRFGGEAESAGSEDSSGEVSNAEYEVDDLDEMWGVEDDINNPEQQSTIEDGSESTGLQPDQPANNEGDEEGDSPENSKSGEHVDTSPDNTDQHMKATEPVVDSSGADEKTEIDQQLGGDGVQDPGATEDTIDAPVESKPETVDDSGASEAEGDQQGTTVGPSEPEPPSFSTLGDSDSVVDSDTDAGEGTTEYEPPSFSTLGDSDTTTDPNTDSDTNTREGTIEPEPPSFSTLGDAGTEADEQQQATESVTEAQQAEMSAEPTVDGAANAGMSDQATEPHPDENTEQGDDPFGFGTTENTGSDPEKGDISFLLDEDSRREVEQKTEINSDDPFAQFADESDTDDGESNLGFLTGDDTSQDEHDDHESDDRVAHPDQPKQTDGGKSR